MSEDIILPVRKCLRLKYYNYSNPGLYFLTLCTHKKANLFWRYPFSSMTLNPAGTMLQHWLDEMEKAFPLSIDCSTIMPNHLHAIIQLNDPTAGGHHEPQGFMAGSGPPLRDLTSTDLVGADLCVGPPQAVSIDTATPSIPTIIQWFKTMSTNAYIRGVKTAAFQPYNGQLWQRSFYDHVIRTEKSHNNIRTYIANNPLKWDQDAENANVKMEVKKYYNDLLS